MHESGSTLPSDIRAPDGCDEDGRERPPLLLPRHRFERDAHAAREDEGDDEEGKEPPQDGHHDFGRRREVVLLAAEVDVEGIGDLPLVRGEQRCRRRVERRTRVVRRTIEDLDLGRLLPAHGVVFGDGVVEIFGKGDKRRRAARLDLRLCLLFIFGAGEGEAFPEGAFEERLDFRRGAADEDVVGIILLAVPDGAAEERIDEVDEDARKNERCDEFGIAEEPLKFLLDERFEFHTISPLMLR